MRFNLDWSCMNQHDQFHVVISCHDLSSNTFQAFNITWVDPRWILNGKLFRWAATSCLYVGIGILNNGRLSLQVNIHLLQRILQISIIISSLEIQGVMERSQKPTFLSKSHSTNLIRTLHSYDSQRTSSISCFSSCEASSKGDDFQKREMLWNRQDVNKGEEVTLHRKMKGDVLQNVIYKTFWNQIPAWNPHVNV